MQPYEQNLKTLSVDQTDQRLHSVLGRAGIFFPKIAQRKQKFINHVNSVFI